MAKHFVANCPVCSAALAITELKCSRCSTRIDTTLPVPPFFHLPEELQEFVLIFLSCRGNIREVEKRLEISYPTVCKKLDQVNQILTRPPGEEEQKAPPARRSSRKTRS